MTKKLLSAILLAVLITVYTTATALGRGGAEQVIIRWEGESLAATALVQDDNLWLPLRDLGHRAGYQVEWEAATKTVLLSSAGGDILLRIGDQEIVANGHETRITAAPLISDGKTLVSLDFVVEHLGLAAAWDRAKGVVELQEILANPIGIETRKIAEDTATLSLNIQYPQVTGISLDAQHKINSLLEKEASRVKAEGLKTEQELQDNGFFEARPSFQVEAYLDYKVTCNQDNVLSLVFTEYQYAGGAHGMTYQRSYTFDLATGEPYRLADFFQEGADYVSLINTEVQKQIAARELALLTPFTSIQPDQDFYLSGEALVIYFQLYEYTPYVAGIQEFPVSLPTLGDAWRGPGRSGPAPGAPAAGSGTMPPKEPVFTEGDLVAVRGAGEWFSLQAVEFVNADTGYVVRVSEEQGAQLLRTRDGGEHWEKIALKDTTLRRLAFVNETTGWAIDEPVSPSAGEAVAHASVWQILFTQCNFSPSFSPTSGFILRLNNLQAFLMPG